MTARLRIYQFCLRLSLYLLLLCGYGAAVYIRFFPMKMINRPVEYDTRFYFVVLVIATLAWVHLSEHYRLCSLESLLNETVGTREVALACIFTQLTVAGALFFYRQQNLSRIFFILCTVCVFVLTATGRRLFRVLMLWRIGSLPKSRTLVVGADDYACKLRGKLERLPFLHADVVGHVSLPEQVRAVRDKPVHELRDLLGGQVECFDHIVIALPPSSLALLSDLVRQLHPLCIPIRAVIDLGGVPIVPDRLMNFRDLQILDLSGHPSESARYILMKRSFDLVFSALIVIAAAPLMLLIALLIRLTSEGPVLFSQDRVGLNGRIFTMYKFRTMQVSDRSKSDTQWYGEEEIRPTRFGRFLRKSGLDELPQFLNVLKGDMSIVGPRPERPFFVGRFLKEIKFYNSRHCLKVGITGLAQVHGWRGDTSIQKRLEYDLYYIQNWSFWLDLVIAWRTLSGGFFAKNTR